MARAGRGARREGLAPPGRRERERDEGSTADRACLRAVDPFTNRPVRSSVFNHGIKLLIAGEFLDIGTDAVPEPGLEAGGGRPISLWAHDRALRFTRRSGREDANAVLQARGPDMQRWSFAPDDDRVFWHGWAPCQLMLGFIRLSSTGHALIQTPSEARRSRTRAGRKSVFFLLFAGNSRLQQYKNRHRLSVPEKPRLARSPENALCHDAV